MILLVVHQSTVVKNERGGRSFFWLGRLLSDFDRRFMSEKNTIYIYIHLHLHTIYIPGACLSSILVQHPSKTRTFPIKARVIWVLGTYTRGAGFIQFFFVARKLLGGK